MPSWSWPKKFNLTKFWYNGGNWLVFILTWFIFSAMMYAAEQSATDKAVTEELMNKRDVEMVAGLVSHQRELLANQSALQQQLGRLVAMLEGSPAMPAVFGQLNLEMALVKDDMMAVIVRMFREEFTRIQAGLAREDEEGRRLTQQLIKFFSENATVAAFSAAGEVQVAQYLEQKGAAHGELEEHEMGWQYGDAVHFTSTVFMNLGYGWRTPLTAGGKWLTLVIILLQIPFYTHCLATLAARINGKLDGIFSYKEFRDDEASLEQGPRKVLAAQVFKGCVVLGGVLFLLTTVSAVFHYVTDLRDLNDFGSVLYFEFVRLSAVGFGDIMPEHEATLVGAIFKNLLLNIPSQIILFTIFIRVLPLLS